MKEYKKLQIIKHALQHYIKRPDANEKDILQESRLLNEINLEVEDLKERYRINVPKSKFTGYIDKNGIAVYENHLVKTSKGIAVICYDRVQGKYKAVPVDLYLSNAGSGGWTGFNLSVVIEVIGDIKNNPELLER